MNKKIIKQQRKYSLKVSYNGQIIQRYQTRSVRRFLKKIRTINWEKLNIEVYVKVSYGKKKDVHGKLVTFYNDGVYDSKQDFIQAINAFLENDKS